MKVGGGAVIHGRVQMRPAVSLAHGDSCLQANCPPFHHPQQAPWLVELPPLGGCLLWDEKDVATLPCHLWGEETAQCCPCPQGQWPDTGDQSL